MNLFKSKTNNKKNNYTITNSDALAVIIPLIGMLILVSLAMTMIKSCSNKTQKDSERVVIVDENKVMCDIHNLNALTKDEEYISVDESNFIVSGNTGILKIRTPNGYIITNNFSVNCKN